MADLVSAAEPDLKTLATEVNLHDARVFEWIVESSSIRATFGWGDLERGYFRTRAVYNDAVLHGAEGDARRWITAAGAEILYDEVDYGTVRAFEHRFSIWPEGEVAIEFSSLALETDASGGSRPER